MSKPLIKPLLFILCAAFWTDLFAGTEIEPRPVNMVEFTCNQFRDKSKTCEAYTCQTPYNLDPTIETEWKIIVKDNDHCVISNTTSNIGLKDNNDNPIPITITCEYDNTGLSTLNSMMDDMQRGYFRSPADNPDGVYECKYTTKGQPINAAPYVMPSDLD